MKDVAVNVRKHDVTHPSRLCRWCLRLLMSSPRVIAQVLKKTSENIPDAGRRATNGNLFAYVIISRHDSDRRTSSAAAPSPIAALAFLPPTTTRCARPYASVAPCLLSASSRWCYGGQQRSDGTPSRTMNLPGLPAVGRRHASSPKTPTKSLPVSPTRWWQRSLDLCLRSRPSGFFHEVTEYPTRQQKHALAVQIAQLEGCEGYNVARVQAYFKDKRKLAHRRAARDGDAATLVSKHAAQAAAVAGEWLSVSSSNYTSCPAEVSCTG